ncbi:Hypothetical_protein [Hexamita inflata]|uniref:Hypothetical_protein n=1 Tax=Hexamita inflata TaxID=28002 RepID=A0AA86TJB2_9EUKA|nr:Hypothetical protein HINF_LOCUS8069 [Hexamita inflata]
MSEIEIVIQQTQQILNPLLQQLVEKFETIRQSQLLNSHIQNCIQNDISGSLSDIKECLHKLQDELNTSLQTNILQSLAEETQNQIKNIQNKITNALNEIKHQLGKQVTKSSILNQKTEFQKVIKETIKYSDQLVTEYDQMQSGALPSVASPPELISFLFNQLINFQVMLNEQIYEVPQDILTLKSSNPFEYTLQIINFPKTPYVSSIDGYSLSLVLEKAVTEVVKLKLLDTNNELKQFYDGVHKFINSLDASILDQKYADIKQQYSKLLM